VKIGEKTVFGITLSVGIAKKSSFARSFSCVKKRTFVRMFLVVWHFYFNPKIEGLFYGLWQKQSLSGNPQF